MAVSPFSGANSTLYYIKEVTRGVTPSSPTLKLLRSTGGFPQVTMDPIESAEIGNGREISDISLGNISIAGEITTELSFGSQDDMLENAMSSQWVDGQTLASLTITVDESLNTFTRDAGDFVADGVAVGDYIQMPALSGNNSRPYFVSAVTPLVVTVSGVPALKPLEAEASTTTDLIIGDTLKTGNDCPTMTVVAMLQGRCGTVTAYVTTTGVEMSGYSLSVDTNAKVSLSFPLVGYDQSSSATPPAGATFEESNGFRPYSDVQSSLIFDGVAQGGFTSISYTNDNAAAPQYTLGSDLSEFVERGNANNSISGTAFMQDTSLLELYRSRADGLRTEMKLSSESGGSMAIVTPQTILTEVTPDRSPTSMTQSISGTAKGDSNNSSVILYRIAL